MNAEKVIKLSNLVAITEFYILNLVKKYNFLINHFSLNLGSLKKKIFIFQLRPIYNHIRIFYDGRSLDCYRQGKRPCVFNIRENENWNQILLFRINTYTTMFHFNLSVIVPAVILRCSLLLKIPSHSLIVWNLMKWYESDLRNLARISEISFGHYTMFFIVENTFP